MSEAALNYVYVCVPKALISPRLIYEYGGGWSVWVEAIDSMYLRRCQPRRIQTHTVMGAIRNARRGLPERLLPLHIHKPLSAGFTCNKSNHLPSHQRVLFLNLKLLIRKRHEKLRFVLPIASHEHTLSPLLSFSFSPPLPCQLISSPSRYCYKV